MLIRKGTIVNSSNMTRIELLAPILLREIGERHYCNHKVVGGRGKWRLVYCRQCNLAAISIAKKLDRSLKRCNDVGDEK